MARLGSALAAIVTAVAFGTIAWATPASAAQEVAVGRIQCAWSGVVRFSPGFVRDGAEPTTVTFHGHTSSCRNTLEGGTAPAGIQSARVTGTFTLPTNQCPLGNTPDREGGPVTYTIRWKSPGRHLEPTTVQQPTAGVTVDNAPPAPRFSSFDAFRGPVTVTGSFFADSIDLLGIFQAPKRPLEQLCAPLTKAGRPGGVKRLRFGDGTFGSTITAVS